MITIKQNKNFSNWFDITWFGKILDQANNERKALRIASQLQRKHYPTSQIKVIAQ